MNSSIGGLSRSLGRDSEKAPGAVLPIDLVANAATLGAVKAAREGYEQAKQKERRYL